MRLIIIIGETWRQAADKVEQIRVAIEAIDFISHKICFSQLVVNDFTFSVCRSLLVCSFQV